MFLYFKKFSVFNYLFQYFVSKKYGFGNFSGIKLGLKQSAKIYSKSVTIHLTKYNPIPYVNEHQTVLHLLKKMKTLFRMLII